MPVLPAVAMVAPQAGAALAAFAISTDDTALHVAHTSSDVVHEAHATSFLRLPVSKQRLWRMLLAPEVAAYKWGHDLWNRFFGHPGRMVEYYAAGSGEHADPIWRDAAKLWHEQDAGKSGNVVWEQKQCYDEHFQPGRDYEECKAQDIMRFPSIKFYAPGRTVGDDFLSQRTPEKLVNFAKAATSPAEDSMARLPGDVSDMKLVDFFSAACPHCTALNPVWEDAHKQWDKVAAESELKSHIDAPLITFEKKECYDDHWNPGKDIDECEKYHITSFPNVKLFVPNDHGHGFRPVEYVGARSTASIVDFLRQHAHIAAEVPSPGPSEVETARFAKEPLGVWIPRAVKAEIMAAGAHAPETMKVLAAGTTTEGSSNADGDIAELQGNTPISAHPPDASSTDGFGGKSVQKPVAETIKTATMPMPLCSFPLSGLSEARDAQRSNCRLPPTALGQFL